MATKKKPRGMTGSAPKEPTPEEMAAFPKRVREAREGHGWRQDDLAEKAGVSQTTVSNMETSASLAGVRLVNAYRVAKALRVSLDELVLGIPDPWARIAKLVEVGKLNPSDVEPKEPGSEPVESPASGSASRRTKKRQR